MKLSFWRKTAAVLMAALLALSTPVLALSETLEAAATAEPTAAPAATVTPVVTEAPVETEATTAPEATTVPEATEAAETPVPETTNASQEVPAKAAPIELLPIDGDVSINAKKPSKLQKTIVDKMEIRAYAMGSEKYGSEMSSCSPSVKAKGVSYEIGAVEGSAEEGWYTTVTFHFRSGDAFELKARDNFNTLYPWSDKLNGDWSYHFTEEWPADQVLTLYRVNNKWCVKSKDGSYSSNISSNIANYIHIYLAVPAAAEYTVTYTDGANGAVFADQTYTVKEGDPTPAFVGKPTREGYAFTGWKPEVAATVTANATYTAQWEKAIPEYTVTYTDGAEGEAFVDQNYTVKEGSATPAFVGKPTRENYTFTGWEPEVAETVTADVTYTAQWTPSTAKKPSKNITANDVKGMKFRAFAEGTEVLLGTMMDCQPSKATGKDVSYTINQIEGNDVDGYTTSVTFHFVSGDKFEIAAREVFNTDRHYTAITGWDNWIGNWTYNFTAERPADQTLTLYWVVASNGKGSWKIKSTTPKFGEWSPNLTTSVANHIKVNLKLERTVTYTDGVNGAAFANQTYTVRNGSATPAFQGSTTRGGYVFTGWDPEVAQTVNGDATYTAKWGEDKNGNGFPDDLEDKFIVTYTDGVNGEAFEDQVYSDLLSGLDTPAFNGTPARKGYVFMGWNPAVTDKVSESVIYTAQWELDENSNGIPDKEEEHYSVTYTDGVSGEAFEDQVYSDLLEGLNTPEFNGTPERKGYVFAGWEPEVAKTVSGNATYTAKWD